MDQISGPNRSTRAFQAWASPSRARVTRSAVGESSRIGVLLAEPVVTDVTHGAAAGLFGAQRCECRLANTGAIRPGPFAGAGPPGSAPRPGCGSPSLSRRPPAAGVPG